MGRSPRHTRPVPGERREHAASGSDRARGRAVGGVVYVAAPALLSGTSPVALVQRGDVRGAVERRQLGDPEPDDACTSSAACRARRTTRASPSEAAPMPSCGLASAGRSKHAQRHRHLEAARKPLGTNFHPFLRSSRHTHLDPGALPPLRGSQVASLTGVNARTRASVS